MRGAASIRSPRYLSSRDITQAEVSAICALKNQSWPHSLESQLAWWKKNTDDDDLFVTLEHDGSLLAFLRLRSRPVSVNGARLDALCATEVCVEKSHQGQGIGARLMGAAVARIEQTASDIGYLLCRDAEEPFYVACGWRRTYVPLLVESSTGARRPLAENERCMTFDPQQRLTGQIVLFGDGF